MIKRVLLVASLLALAAPLGAQRQATQTTAIQVFKSPTCGCCANWVKHLQQYGFTTTVTEMEDVSAVKAKYKVPARLGSCHTAIVDGYVLEGHVPAADVQRLLKERPAVAGLAVPGMPIGSPGMEVASMKPQAYQVVAFERDGQYKVFASH
jgi:hypothetical protein